MGHRSSVRLLAVIILCGVLITQITRQALTQNAGVPIELIDRQQMVADVTAPDCNLAVPLAHYDDASIVPATDVSFDSTRISSRAATRIADRILDGYVPAEQPAVESDMLLVRATFANGERLVWGRLRLLSSVGDEAAVVYVDDELGIPLLLFTDVVVESTRGCTTPPTGIDIAHYLDELATLLLGMGFSVIGFGLVSLYRTRVQAFVTDAVA